MALIGRLPKMFKSGVSLTRAAAMLAALAIVGSASVFGQQAVAQDFDYYYWDDNAAPARSQARPQAQQPQQQPSSQGQQSAPAQGQAEYPPHYQERQAGQPAPQQSTGHPASKHPTTPEVRAAAANEYRLGSGDQLRMTVFGQKELSGEFEVDGTGNATFPLIGQMRVAGFTTRQIEQMVESALSPNYLRNPRVGVEVLNYRPFYILGEVAKPGSYPFVSGMRVINAVALAGGYTYRAQKNDIQIERAVNGTKEPADHNSVVLPGDIVHVPERFF